MKEKYQGALCMVLSALSFAIMQILIAVNAGAIPLFEQLFFSQFDCGAAGADRPMPQPCQPAWKAGEPENFDFAVSFRVSGNDGAVLRVGARGAGRRGDFE